MQRDVSDPLVPFTVKLERRARDLDDGEHDADAKVLRNPFAPDKFLPVNDDNCRTFVERGFAWDDASLAKTWLMDRDLWPAALGDQVKRRSSLATRFKGNIDENLMASRGCRMPLMGLPWWTALLPVSPRVATPKAFTDLTGELVEILCRQGSLPAACKLNETYAKLLSDCNALRIYRIAGIPGGRVYAVVAFVSPVKFAPLAPFTFVSLDVSLVNEIQRVCEQWLDSRGDRGTLTFYTFGSAENDADLPAIQTSDRLLMFSQAGQDDEERWISKIPTQLANRPAVRDFVDRLTPETSAQRAARIAVLVKQRMAAHRGHVDLEWLAQASKYRRSTVVEAMWVLQDLGHYRLYLNDKKVLCIEPTANSTHAPLHRKVGPNIAHYVREAILAGVTEGLTFCVGWAIHHPKLGLLAGGFLCWLRSFIKRILSEHDSDKE